MVVVNANFRENEIPTRRGGVSTTTTKEDPDGNEEEEFSIKMEGLRKKTKVPSN